MALPLREALGDLEPEGEAEADRHSVEEPLPLREALGQCETEGEPEGQKLVVEDLQ